uniref:GAF domain-containing protein n=1 Tax=Entomoneis paludosa TaxID=265537 RepID=A0A7S3DTV0_9STRA
MVDEANSEPQTMEQELKRLQTLQSYFVLDSEGEEQFDRITRMAAQVFDVPIALVSLVDLGRQWFLSRVGLDASVTETPRQLAFCAHTIISKHKTMVIPDASQDFRFQNNPFVTDGLKVRFYAGAALISPEGYKLGTLCMISPTARPQGLTDSQQVMLEEMGSMVVSAMVARRNRMVKQDYEERFKALAATFVETSQQLNQAKETLTQVLERQSWDMDHEDTVQLSELARDLDMRSQICAATTRNILMDVVTGESIGMQEEKTCPRAASTEEETSSRRGSVRDSLASVDTNASYLAETLLGFDEIVNPSTDMTKLFDNVNAIVAKFPYRDHVTVELHKSVPKRIIAEDLLLFRSVLNLLTHCMGQQEDASEELNQSGIVIRRSASRDDELLVKAVQRGKAIPKERANDLFKNKDSLLAPVATMVRSMGGRYGMYEGKWTHGGATGTTGVQSIFWFQIPYGLLESDLMEPSQNTLDKTLLKSHDMSLAHGSAHSTTTSKTAGSNMSLDTDPFQRALLEAGCGGR